MFHGVSESLGPPPPPPSGPPPGYEAEDYEDVDVEVDDEVPAPPGLASSSSGPPSPSYGRKSNKMPHKRGAASAAERDSSDQDKLEMDRVTWVQFNFRLSA